jgi:hypothetical protein
MMGAAEFAALLLDSRFCSVCDGIILPLDPETGRKTRSDKGTCGKESCARQERRVRRKYEAEEKARRHAPSWEPDASGFRAGCDCKAERRRDGLPRNLYLDTHTDGGGDLRCRACGKLATQNGKLVEAEPGWLKALTCAWDAQRNGVEPGVVAALLARDLRVRELTPGQVRRKREIDPLIGLHESEDDDDRYKVLALAVALARDYGPSRLVSSPGFVDARRPRHGGSTQQGTQRNVGLPLEEPAPESERDQAHPRAWRRAKA